MKLTTSIRLLLLSSTLLVCHADDADPEVAPAVANLEDVPAVENLVDVSAVENLEDVPAVEQLEAIKPKHYFNRISSFLPCTFLDANCNVDDETGSEEMVATRDGQTIIYTDPEREVLGFVDVTDPKSPMGLNTLDVPGVPTSVAIIRNFLLATVDTSNGDFVNPSGMLKIIDPSTQAIVFDIDVGGQPDTVAVSKDEKYIVVSVENQHNPDEGLLPQAPPGFLLIFDSSAEDPQAWTSEMVDLTHLDGCLFPYDPEPEVVSINKFNMAVVTLQENNCIAIVNLARKKVVKSMSAGKVQLGQVDATTDELISQSETIKRTREPDGVSWITNKLFATANEGNLLGGSRSFTIFHGPQGRVVYESGNQLEHLSAKLGHYPEFRSSARGNEPETVKYVRFGYNDFLFVLSERSNLVFVYDVSQPDKPAFLQALPVGIGPSSVLAFPRRNLLAVAAQVDARGAGARASITFYEYGPKPNQYPTLVSANRKTGVPIPWGAVSGLVAPTPSDMPYESVLHAVLDNAYKKSKILKISLEKKPAVIVKEIFLLDKLNRLGHLPLRGEFSLEDRDALINKDKTVNLDLEGIAETKYGFWVANEGGGTVGDVDDPVTSLNMILEITSDGIIKKVITLPDEVNDMQTKNGFEGVVYNYPYVIVAFQSPWGDDPGSRIGFYNTINKRWKFVFYPLDEPESQNGGSVGVSELTSIGNGKFLVLERDDQGGPDAAIKRIYEIDLGVNIAKLPDGYIVSKKLRCDLIPELEALGGQVPLKIESMAATMDTIWIAYDNDGTSETNGETQLLNVCGTRAYY